MTIDEIKFIETKLREPLSVSLRALPSPGGELLNIAFKHGGYIAGGFGIVVARCEYLLKNHDEDDCDIRYAIRDHVGQYNGLIVTQNHYSSVNHGDIDVWFSNIDQLNSFLNDPDRLNMWNKELFRCEPTLTGCALEHIVAGTTRIQVIKQFLLPMHEQLSRFDIYNSMVGLTDTTLTIPEKWLELEQINTLHVHDWRTSQWTINRLFKYMNKKHYTTVTKETANKIADEVVNTLEWFAENKESMKDHRRNIGKFGQSLNKLQKTVVMSAPVIKLIKQFLPSMSNEKLMLMSSLLDYETNYNYAMKEFINRNVIKGEPGSIGC